MSRAARRWGGWSAILWPGLLLSGCMPHYQDPMHAVHATLPTDVTAAATLGPLRPVVATAETPPEQAPPPRKQEGDKGLPPGKAPDLLTIPPAIPGSEAPPIRLPPLDRKDQAERDKAIDKLYPGLPPLGEEIQPPPGPGGTALTLADLQKLARAHSPTLRRAAQDVGAARGAALQAGLHPNPTFGYEADQVQPGPAPTNNVGQQGFYLNQLIKTGGKLELARAASGMDVLNAEVALRAAQVDLISRVRAGYFAVLVAEESIRVSRALAELTDEAFRIQVRQVKGAQAAPYEPFQLYVYAVLARNNLIQARNHSISAWKQLAATMGLPDLPCTAVAGRADAPAPCFAHDSSRAQMLAVHTNLLTAENTILKARYSLRLAEVTRLPDVATNFVWQHDNATANDQFNLQIGFAVPVWDRNQGNILQARAQMARAQEDLTATRNGLIQSLADAYERYLTNKTQVEQFRERILGNQVRVYRAIRERFQQEPEKISYADIVNAQQAIANTLGTYLALLGTQWTAVVDLVTLLQVDELYPPGHDSCPAPGGTLPGPLQGTILPPVEASQVAPAAAAVLLPPNLLPVLDRDREKGAPD